MRHKDNESTTYLYLMFKSDNDTQVDASLFYFKMSYQSRLIDGKLEPTKVNNWKFSDYNQFTHYTAGNNEIVAWADVYLVGSNKMTSFMNWDGNPFN